jgi:hypothetical protein
VRVLQTPAISRPIYLIRRRGRTLSAAAEALASEILQAKIESPPIAAKRRS